MKQLYICRERVFDVRFRLGNVITDLFSRGQDVGELEKFQPQLEQLEKILEGIERDNIDLYEFNIIRLSHIRNTNIKTGKYGKQ